MAKDESADVFRKTITNVRAKESYLPTYYRIASELGTRATVCELGVNKGASLTLWLSLFQSGRVVGVDVNAQSVWPERTFKIVSDQVAYDLPLKLANASADGLYDLIIDDASHDGILTKHSWLLLWPLVRPGGYYVIEDWFVGVEGNIYYDQYGDSMLKTAQYFLGVMDQVNNKFQVESIEYKYGLIVIKKGR